MKTTRGVGSLLLGIFMTAVSYPAFSHDPSKPNEPYHQTDLQELHAIVESVRESAGPEQLAQLNQSEATADPELQTLSKRAVIAHRLKVELLLQDVIDRRAFEKAQANELKAADALSKSIDDALTRLAKTLTPEQRSHFLKHIQAHQD